MTYMVAIQDLNPDHPVSGVLTLRVVLNEPIENVMVFVSGVFIAQFYERPGPNKFGVMIRHYADPGNDAVEFDIDTTVLPNGIHSVYVSAYRPVTVALFAELRAMLNIQNLASPLTTQAVSLPKPQFGKAGLLSSYEQSMSIIPRTMFGATVHEFAHRPELIPQYKAAGFNAMFTGIGINSVRDIPGCTQEQFEAAQRVRIDAAVSLCQEHGLLCLGDTMDWTYSASMCIPILDKPWAEQGIKNTFAYMKAAGVFIGVDLCDETGFRWSEADIIYARKLSKAARLGGLPVAWTTGPMSSETPDRDSAWAEGHYWSDYLSLGRDVVDWTYSGDPTVDQFYRAMYGAAYAIRTDCPFLINANCCDFPTVNSVPGKKFADYHALTEIGFAIALGAAGIKVYHLDTLAWKAERASGNGQQGCDPESLPLRWQAMSHAMNAVAELESLILQPQVECETGGRWFATRAWNGDNGKLWLAVNRLTISQTAVLPRGYASGYTLGMNGKTVISAKSNTAMVEPGGWAVLKTEFV